MKNKNIDDAIAKRIDSSGWDEMIAVRVIGRKKSERRMMLSIGSGIAASCVVVVSLLFFSMDRENDQSGFISAQVVGVYDSAYSKKNGEDPVDDAIVEMMAF